MITFKINTDILIQLLIQFTSKQDICSYFNISSNDLDKFILDNFNMPYDTLENTMKIRGQFAIRQAQLELAKTKPEMAKWLGIQYCGQKDSENNSEKVYILANPNDLPQDIKDLNECK